MSLEEEIRRSPVEVGSLSHHLQGFIHPRWLAGFLKSTVGILYYIHMEHYTW